MDNRIRIFLYTLTSQYQNQSFSARDLTNPLRCPDTNRIRVDVRLIQTTSAFDRIAKNATLSLA